MAFALRRSAAVSQEAFAAAVARAKVHLDGITGAQELQRLAETVAARDAQFSSSRTTLRAAKTSFEAALQSRTATQSEINALLQVRGLRRRCARAPSCLRCLALLKRVES
jgi:hypothetical protein